VRAATSTGEALPPLAVRGMANLDALTSANLGTATFRVRIQYDQAVNLSSTPTVTFSTDVSSTLTYNAASSFRVSDRIFYAWYNVADTNVNVSNIGIQVTAVTDPNGNVQPVYNLSNVFTIDTVS
jgi:hypothetical protein